MNSRIGNKIKKWHEMNKIKDRLALEKEGFGWAMVAYHIERVSIEELEVLVSYSDDGIAFPAGAKAAITILKNEEHLTCINTPCKS